MTRVAIIGNAGGGKSTLARRLGTRLGLPHFAVDRILWRPGWVEAPAAEFAAAHEAWIARDRWIIDGVGPADSIARRFARCDTIVHLDLPLWRHLWWALKRQASCLVRPRVDGPEGCPMLPVTGRLLAMIWRLDRELRPSLKRLMAAEGRHAEVIVLRSPREIAAFLAHVG